jgi:hypothetical protein
MWTSDPLIPDAWRAAIILSSAYGVGTNEIMRRTGKSNCGFVLFVGRRPR